MTEKKEAIEDIDWRVRVATVITKDTLGKDGEVIYSKGTPVTLTTFSRFNDREISFGDPSATALFLNQSHKSFEEALAIQPFLKEWPPSDAKPTARVYDYLEAIYASVVFAYTALEAFVNEEIPENFIYEVEEQTDSGLFSVNQFDKEQIERKFSLSEKLASILPKALGSASPKGTSEWEEFVYLRRFRDRIIHMKAKDREPSKFPDKYPKSIWNDLLDPNQRKYPLIAKSMILFFKPKEGTHWLKYCPF